MKPILPEKARLLERLREGRFNVPDFVFVPAGDFENSRFEDLERFLGSHDESFKVIARSAHPMEEFYKGGTFESLETYCDLSGIFYARKRMIHSAESDKHLSILRQQQFNNAPELNMEEMGVVVMPFLDGMSVMAKMVGDHWEFGYCRDRDQKVQTEPYITKTPHDRRLLQISEDIQKYLGFRCEIEYILSPDGEIYVVQAKDISHIDILEQKESDRLIRLDGVRRIRKRRNYRERPIFVMDARSLYLDIISRCEDLVLGGGETRPSIDDILDVVADYERKFNAFALRHERFAVLGISLKAPVELYQVANHYLDDTPELQKQLSKALHDNLYKMDHFLAEADTLVAKVQVRVNICSHDAYGVNTVRNPLWSVFWRLERHEEVLKEFRRLGFKTGDTVAIEIDAEDKPTVYRQ
jgi:hypothetical protein